MIATSTRAGTVPPLFQSVKRFLRSPKGQLLLLLGAVTVLASLGGGMQAVTAVAVASGSVLALDLLLWWVRTRTLVAPSGAVLTGLLVGLVLSPIEPWYIVALTAAAAIASKHLLRTRWSNIFNPAAFGLVVTGVALGSIESWWGALPDAGVLGAVEILLVGAFVVNQVNKFPMVLAFLGVFYALAATTTFLTSPAAIAEVFRAPDAQAALFFAVFMLDDPPTSPVRYVDQVCFGALVGTVAFATFLRWGPVYYLSAGLLVGNAWESSRRYLRRSSRSAALGPRAVG